ncbi:glycosyltransferase [Bradyrhizobium vignae]|uniref:Glycosyltransferase n=1 Tax=Bradyrhizobium vignae TaxID=1549949 RepID=A0ABS3ZQB7_9BRAD|nr:glycosyltransferase [Bradyrhizobium vignae]MBP0110349.1 glycosyltransferase [Bradyrhizobium vignae]
MRILAVHNRYKERGGEDTVFEAEVELLRSAGHSVETLIATNDDIVGAIGRVRAAFGSVYNIRGRRRVANAISEAKPDIVHVHNFFPLLSPAIFDACQDAAVPAVLTLHNYRLACANALLLRNELPCEKCLVNGPLWSVAHACYRNSRAGSLAVSGMIAYHRFLGTWKHKVSRFIALTEFARSRFIAAGLPADKLAIKPNFIRQAPLPLTSARGRSAVFVGRLSREKGAHILLEAWRELDIPLTIVGEGPEGSALRAMNLPHVQFTGRVSHEKAMEIVSRTGVLIVPSIWYENLPMTLVEAKSLGVPAIVSRIGALPEIVADGVDGVLFNPGDSSDLARTVRKVFENQVSLVAMGRAARATYEERFTEPQCLRMLLGIYGDAISSYEAEQTR